MRIIHECDQNARLAFPHPVFMDKFEPQQAQRYHLIQDLLYFFGPDAKLHPIGNQSDFAIFFAKKLRQTTTGSPTPLTLQFDLVKLKLCLRLDLHRHSLPATARLPIYIALNIGPPRKAQSDEMILWDK